MSKRKVRTKKDEQRVDKEYGALVSKFRPVFGDDRTIRLSREIGRVALDEGLIVKHEGRTTQRLHCTNSFKRKEALIKSLNYYFKTI